MALVMVVGGANHNPKLSLHMYSVHDQ